MAGGDAGRRRDEFGGDRVAGRPRGARERQASAVGGSSPPAQESIRELQLLGTRPLIDAKPSILRGATGVSFSAADAPPNLPLEPNFNPAFSQCPISRLPPCVRCTV